MNSGDFTPSFTDTELDEFLESAARAEAESAEMREIAIHRAQAELIIRRDLRHAGYQPPKNTADIHSFGEVTVIGQAELTLAKYLRLTNGDLSEKDLERLAEEKKKLLALAVVASGMKKNSPLVKAMSLIYPTIQPIDLDHPDMTAFHYEAAQTELIEAFKNRN